MDAVDELLIKGTHLPGGRSVPCLLNKKTRLYEEKSDAHHNHSKIVLYMYKNRKATSKYVYWSITYACYTYACIGTMESV